MYGVTVSVTPLDTGTDWTLGVRRSARSSLASLSSTVLMVRQEIQINFNNPSVTRFSGNDINSVTSGKAMGGTPDELTQRCSFWRRHGQRVEEHSGQRLLGDFRANRESVKMKLLRELPTRYYSDCTSSLS